MKTTLILIVALFALAQSQFVLEGEYKISSSTTGWVFDISNAYTGNGVPLLSWSWGGGENQKFNIEYVDGVWATIVAKHSNKAITVSGNAVGATYTQEDKTGGFNQQFKFTPTADGFWIITNRASQLVITCPDYQSPVQGNKVCDKIEKFNLELLSGGATR